MDNTTQREFDVMKYVLVWASLLYPPNCQHDYFLYFVVPISTIKMVLVQEDYVGIENPIYYLSWNLNDTDIRYTQVENLALATIKSVQRFCHYILLRKTTNVSDYDPMTYILLRQLLGGEYSKWIFILQEFFQEVIKSKSKKSLVFAKLMCDLTSLDS